MEAEGRRRREEGRYVEGEEGGGLTERSLLRGAESHPSDITCSWAGLDPHICRSSAEPHRCAGPSEPDRNRTVHLNRTAVQDPLNRTATGPCTEPDRTDTGPCTEPDRTVLGPCTPLDRYRTMY